MFRYNAHLDVNFKQHSGFIVLENEFYIWYSYVFSSRFKLKKITLNRWILCKEKWTIFLELLSKTKVTFLCRQSFLLNVLTSMVLTDESWPFEKSLRTVRKLLIVLSFYQLILYPLSTVKCSTQYGVWT